MKFKNGIKQDEEEDLVCRDCRKNRHGFCALIIFLQSHPGATIDITINSCKENPKNEPARV